jgi:hypothetical protein
MVHTVDAASGWPRPTSLSVAPGGILLTVACSLVLLAVAALRRLLKRDRVAANVDIAAV